MWVEPCVLYSSFGLSVPVLDLVHYGKKEVVELYSQLEPEYSEWLHFNFEEAAEDPYRHPMVKERMPAVHQDLGSVTSSAVTDVGFPNARALARLEKYIAKYGNWHIDFVSSFLKRLFCCVCGFSGSRRSSGRR